MRSTHGHTGLSRANTPLLMASPFDSQQAHKKRCPDKCPGVPQKIFKTNYEPTAIRLKAVTVNPLLTDFR